MQELSYLKINPLDNVAVALVDLECGFEAVVDGKSIVLKEDIGTLGSLPGSKTKHNILLCHQSAIRSQQ